MGRLVKRLSMFLSALALSWPMVAPLQAAEGMRVSSGALTFASHVGHIDIRGKSGFSMQATVDDAGGIFDAGNQCSFECTPGTELSLFALWLGSDLSGAATLRGQKYLLGHEGEGGAFGIVQFDGEVTLPEFTDSGTAELSAPFSFVGQITADDPSGSGDTEPFFGTGVATLMLSVAADGTSWHLDSTTYEFQRVNAASATSNP
jgi:hypothetical protein